MTNFSTLIRFVSNGNPWPLVAVLMMLEVIVIDIMNLKVYFRDDVISNANVNLLDNRAEPRSFLDHYYAKGTHMEMKTIMVIQCAVMCVMMALESGRGFAQLLRDLGPALPWQVWFVLILVSIGMVMVPLMYKTEYWQNSRQIFVGMLGMIITLDAMAGSDRFLGGFAAIILSAYAFYWFIDLWFWIAQYVIFAVMVCYNVITITCLMAARLVYSSVVFIVDVVSGAYARRKEAQRLSAELASAVHAIKSDRAEFTVESEIDSETGRNVIDIYDILSGLRAEALREEIHSEYCGLPLDLDIEMSARALAAPASKNTSLN